MAPDSTMSARDPCGSASGCDDRSEYPGVPAGRRHGGDAPAPMLEHDDDRRDVIATRDTDVAHVRDDRLHPRRDRRRTATERSRPLDDPAHEMPDQRREP